MRKTRRSWAHRVTIADVFQDDGLLSQLSFWGKECSLPVGIMLNLGETSRGFRDALRRWFAAWVQMFASDILHVDTVLSAIVSKSLRVRLDRPLEVPPRGSWHILHLKRKGRVKTERLVAEILPKCRTLRSEFHRLMQQSDVRTCDWNTALQQAIWVFENASRCVCFYTYENSPHTSICVLASAILSRDVRLQIEFGWKGIVRIVACGHAPLFEKRFVDREAMHRSFTRLEKTRCETPISCVSRGLPLLRPTIRGPFVFEMGGHASDEFL